MRGFWAATLGFMIAFVGWFAFAPLMPYVMKDIGICDNAAEVALDVENAVCKCGIEGCRQTLANVKMASVSLDVFTRFILGAVMERLGPCNTDVLLLAYGTVIVAASAAVTNAAGLLAARFFVSAMGSTFVVNQFWNAILFKRSAVGTANATAGGWGNLGGGLVQTLMPACYSMFHDGFGMGLSASWRWSMFVPATLYATLAIWIKCCSQDTPKGKFDVRWVGKAATAGPGTYLQCLSDYRVTVMSMQYGACFGAELVMNNTLTPYFHTKFKVPLTQAGVLAMCFGGMNLFARSLGGIFSDWINLTQGRWRGMPGRLWVHFICLLGQSITMFLFASVTADQGWGLALAALVVFASFVNAAEGTSYAIVPYMIPEHVAVVSGIVGAGGTLGAVIASSTIYRFTDSDSAGMQWHSLYVLFWTFSCFTLSWPHLGNMLEVFKPSRSKAQPSPAKKPLPPAGAKDAKPTDKLAEADKPAAQADKPVQALETGATTEPKQASATVDAKQAVAPTDPGAGAGPADVDVSEEIFATI